MAILLLLAWKLLEPSARVVLTLLIAAGAAEAAGFVLEVVRTAEMHDSQPRNLKHGADDPLAQSERPKC